MRRWTAIFAAACFSFVTNTAAWETSGFYAHNKLIRVGMPKAEVLTAIGTSLEQQKTSGHAGAKTKKKGSKQPEIWTYHGSDGAYTLIFSGDNLAHIDVKPARDL